MSTQAVMGHEGKWAFAASNALPSTTSFSGSTPTFSMISDTLGKSDTLGYSRGIRGTRGQVVEGSRKTASDITGTLTMEVSPEWLDFIIPIITGDTSSPFTVQEDLGFGFDYVRYDGITGKSRMFRNVLINVMRLSFNGEFVTMSLDLVALSETEVTFAGAALQTGIGYEPYIPAELVLTAGDPNAARDIETATLVLNNALAPRRRMKLTPQCYLAGIRTVQLNTDAEWGSVSEAELYGLDEDGFAATLTLTRENMSSVILLTRLQVPDNTPGITGPDEILYPIAGVARGVGATGELSWTNDSTN